MLVIVTKRP